MKTHLSAAGEQLFGLLTHRTLYVVDTEYTAANDERGGNRLISIAIVPISLGRRPAASSEFYCVMNPGVPISKESTRVHGFTDASVQGKKGFAYYAPKILAALNDPAGVFVNHTTADARVLLDELSRLDDRAAAGDPAATVGVADMPDLPIIDTSTVARMLKYDGVGHRGVLSLASLCALTGATYKGKAHNARVDARATADALLELLAHTAQHCVYWDLDTLLADHRAGTTREPRGPAYIRSKRDVDPDLPPEHIAKHTDPLVTGASKQQIADWTALALECAQLRCQWLRDEARVAADLNAAALIDPLMGLLPQMTEPGQAGTLLGAVHELIDPSQPVTGKPGMVNTRAMRWWGKNKQAISDSPPLRRDVKPDVPDMPPRRAMLPPRAAPPHSRDRIEDEGRQLRPEERRLPLHTRQEPQPRQVAGEAPRGRRVRRLAHHRQRRARTTPQRRRQAHVRRHRHGPAQGRAAADGGGSRHAGRHQGLGRCHCTRRRSPGGPHYR